MMSGDLFGDRLSALAYCDRTTELLEKIQSQENENKDLKYRYDRCCSDRKDLEIERTELMFENFGIRKQIKALRIWASNEVESCWWLNNKIDEIFGEE